MLLIVLRWASLNSSASPFPKTPPPFCDWLYSDRLHTIDRLCNVPFDLLSCVKLYAQQHFTSCFIVYFSLTPVLGIYFRVYFLFIAVQSRKSYPSEFQQINVD
ncbi:hypothetical protein T06_2894 [Trichinella sp. T6]|nr:hypothetical protein T06_2894 [Trichinella sp. T6]